MVIVAFLTSSLTGYPRNIEAFDQGFYFFEESTFILKDFILEPNENIYIWAINSNRVPMSLRLDWDDNLAESLHQATIDVEKTGGDIKVTTENNDEGESANLSIRTTHPNFFIKE